MFFPCSFPSFFPPFPFSLMARAHSNKRQRTVSTRDETRDQQVGQQRQTDRKRGGADSRFPGRARIVGDSWVAWV